MQKYDVWFCHCGHIQLMPNDYYKWLEEDSENRYIIRVCQNCGRAIKIWLDKSNDGFDVCSTNIKNFVIEPTDVNNVRIIFNEGIEVPIIGGTYATYQIAGTWWDDDQNKGVDTRRLIAEVKDPDILKSIAAYVSGIDWSGTEYEYKF